jgi:exopolysaccharide biosynthesis protein
MGFPYNQKMKTIFLNLGKEGKTLRTPAPKKTTQLRAILAFLLALSGIAYLLADRYLIEHVEISDVSAYASSATTAVATSSRLPQTATMEPSRVLPLTSTVEPAAAVMADDWHYQSETVSIAITKVTTGSGNNAVTYFVADVVVSDATQLTSAFAKNSFGRNIIEYTSQIAQNHNAIFAINGDYYGFRSDGILIRNGVIYRDSAARTGLAFYKDGTLKIYDETQTNAQALLDEGVWNTLSFGPALLENSVVATNLNQVEIDTNFGNHSIQGSNPRTGVGLIDTNHFVFVVVDGRSSGYSRGVTLTEFAQIFKELGCSTAYNLDGGGSSTMYFRGRVVNDPLGRNQERGTSDILFIAQ